MPAQTPRKSRKRHDALKITSVLLKMLVYCVTGNTADCWRRDFIVTITTTLLSFPVHLFPDFPVLHEPLPFLVSLAEDFLSQLSVSVWCYAVFIPEYFGKSPLALEPNVESYSPDLLVCADEEEPGYAEPHGIGVGSEVEAMLF